MLKTLLIAALLLCFAIAAMFSLGFYTGFYGDQVWSSHTQHVPCSSVMAQGTDVVICP